MMDLYEAMHTAIFEFDNNVAHSNVKVTHVITWYLKSRNCLNLQLVRTCIYWQEIIFCKKKINIKMLLLIFLKLIFDRVGCSSTTS